MSTVILKENALNQLKKGTVLFQEGTKVHSFGMIVKGSVLIQSSGGVQRLVKTGTLAAVEDLFSGEYSGDYTTQEDTIFYAFPASGADQLELFLDKNAEYRGIAVYSMEQALAGFVKEQDRLLLIAEEQGGETDQFRLGDDTEKRSYYQEAAKIPVEAQKNYFRGSISMVMHHINEIAGMIQELSDSCLKILQYIEELTPKEILQPEPSAVTSVTEDEAIKLLGNSLFQIVKAAELDPAEQKEIITAVNAFVDTKDRLSTQDDMRRLRKQIIDGYYCLYKILIFKWLEDETVPYPVKLFLNYGFIDERLLDEEQLRYLIRMAEARYDDLPCPVYTMPEWLKEIYEGRKEPSRDSFEVDYRDMLRKKQRSGAITEKQEQEYLEDKHRKVIFEIENMFTSNNKIVNGRLSSYVPILYKDEFYGSIERLFLTKKQLCDSIMELEQKDFTVFQREVLYTNPELNITKEYVIKRIYPDVIQAPVYGTTSSMWQEITGRRRDTPARFIFPVISENEVSKLVTKAFGRLHWEYCRCEQGAAWNNIQYKSLTSEYMDYIQYYRKNHELSEEKRDKIKSQILRARNNSREIFLIDYEMWIEFESNSAMKLNKVSRAILATYCPFQKEIRESLKNNMPFVEAMAAQQRQFGEKAREWDLRIKRRENNNLEVPDEFYTTYHYYADN